MKAIYLFDITAYSKGSLTYLSAALLVCFGMFTGNQFNMSVGEGIYLNSPYTIGFMLGLLSLSVIFIATIVGSQLLFKEWDGRFDQLLFSTSLTKLQFTRGRFVSFYVLTLTGFLLLAIGFIIGQNMRSGTEMQPGFYLTYYLYPLFLFGCINSLFVCSVLSLVAWQSKNKLLVAVSGLLLYILYMIVLLFSSSPFMAQATPQSAEVQQVSTIVDPFGLSAYFFMSKHFTVTERNALLTPLTGSLLINRLLVVTVSLLFLYLGEKYFSFSARKNKQKRNTTAADNGVSYISFLPSSYQTARTAFTKRMQLNSVISFLKTDLTYIFKSIPIVITTILLLFSLGMEMYAEIEKGIRLPQKFASSGLMASTILENFHLLGLLLVVYYVNDLYWRSAVYRFSMLENVTVLSYSKQLGHWLSCAVLIMFFSVMSVILGLVFQLAYEYTQIDVAAYSGVLVFNSFPLILLAGFLVLLNRMIPHKYLALGVSLLIVLLTASPLANKIIGMPLLRFFIGFKEGYSDFIGYGTYLASFTERLLFGFCLILLMWLLQDLLKDRQLKWLRLASIVVLVITGMFFAKNYMNGYAPKNRQQSLEIAADYEKQFRKYQSIPQPSITDIKTKIHLYPSKNSYAVEGTYIIRNLTNNVIQKLLINFDRDLKIEKANYVSSREVLSIQSIITELTLQHPLQPQDTATLHFELSYAWKPVNGHQSFNAIIENGSFMRISRYYPKIGYQPEYEIIEETERKQFGLGTATPTRKLEDPKTTTTDLINLDMEVDTEVGQTAVGSGDLINEWTKNDRIYFHYKTPQPVPFRFAVSSAKYKIKSDMHEGTKITILYHPDHEENVEHLIKNVKLTLDYCINNFGTYPYQSVTFAEVSSFTRGFAATAYPATIFMTENMLFHANINADKKQDVINELAGHELSHLWWGGNQVAPDDREGAPMLTETLAMYTEMMLYKKMYGKEKMMERVKMHQQIYEAEKGFSENQPLSRVTANNTHISYSKGAMIMVKLSELIGEDKVNEALKNFLSSCRYSNTRPVSADLINEILKVADKTTHPVIKKLFMEL